MTKVTAQMSLSLDGCYAGPAFGGESKDVAGWMGSPEALGFFRVTRWVIGAMAWRERQGWRGGSAVGELRHRRGDVRRCRGLRDGPAHVRGR